MSIATGSAYQGYKDSGVNWLGAIPDEWNVRRFRFLCSSGTGERNTEDKEENGTYPFFVRSQKPERINTYSYDGEAILTAGDGAGVGKVYHYINGKFDFHQRVYKFSDFNDVEGKYLFYYISTNFASVALLGTAKSTVDSLRLPLIQDFPIAFPKRKEEQLKIAAFLDSKCAKIDEAVRIKEAQIKLLRERRQTLIQQAVTRGLNPDVPMKDSGIDWIGEIPAHWGVKQFKHLLSEPLKYGANEEAKECVEGDPRYIRITDFGSDGKLKDDTKRTLPQKTARDYLLKKGDILLARSGGTVGKSFLFEEEIEACFAGYLIMARCSREEILSRYMNLFLRSSSFEHWKELIFSRATIQNIGADKYGALVLPVPPISEQRSMLNHVEALSAKIDRAISIKRDQIAKLKEYKTSLINAAVTGKIKVS